MAAEMKQRLCALLAADAVGYSQLMGVSPQDTVRALDAARDVFRAKTVEHGGAVIDTAGDSVLCTFETATGAVQAATEIQRELQRSSQDSRGGMLKFRVGIHLGEVLQKDDGTIYGEGVNVAARLQALAPPGGVWVSETIRNAAHPELRSTMSDRGLQQLKNIQELVRAYSVGSSNDARQTGSKASAPFTQKVKFARTADGVRIAYAESGAGIPLVRAAHWMTNIELDWKTSILGEWIKALAADHRLIRYDPRGSGLSGRDIPQELSLETSVRDMEAVVDAAGLERFALLGLSQGGAASIAYAARYPERVSHLVLLNGYARGLLAREPTPQNEALLNAMAQLVRAGWGQNNPAFRQVFTTQFVPGATATQIAEFNELQRESSSPDHTARLLHVLASMDATALLSQVKCPTLVLHCRGDVRVPFEEGLFLASEITHAHFEALDSPNHHPLPGEPAFHQALDLIRDFLRADETTDFSDV